MSQFYSLSLFLSENFTATLLISIILVSLSQEANLFLKPTLLINGDITDIDLADLKVRGIKGLILDLDSTLIAPKTAELTDGPARWLEAARRDFKVAIASNNKNEAYLDQIRAMLDMTIIGRAAKPSRKAFRVLLSEFGLSAEEVAVIGDRPLTDIWGGHRAGMTTILVGTLKTMNEPKWKTTIRNMERIFIRCC